MSGKLLTAKSALAVLCMCLGSSAMSQAVKTADEPYVLAPAKQSADADLPIAEAVKVEAVKAPALLTLLPGKTVASQLQELVESSGWQLAWDAAEFSVDQKVTVTAELNKAVTELVEAANAGGTRIKATFYRGNKVVRISEY